MTRRERQISGMLHALRLPGADSARAQCVYVCVCKFARVCVERLQRCVRVDDVVQLDVHRLDLGPRVQAGTE